MPQSITGKLTHLITCAATDLVTVSYGGTEGSVYIKNGGPGKVYVSFDPTTPATVAGTATLLLASGDTYTAQGIGRANSYGTPITLIADTASTMVSLSFAGFQTH